MGTARPSGYGRRSSARGNSSPQSQLFTFRLGSGVFARRSRTLLVVPHEGKIVGLTRRLVEARGGLRRGIGASPVNYARFFELEPLTGPCAPHFVTTQRGSEVIPRTLLRSEPRGGIRAPHRTRFARIWWRCSHARNWRRVTDRSQKGSFGQFRKSTSPQHPEIVPPAVKIAKAMCRSLAKLGMAYEPMNRHQNSNVRLAGRKTLIHWD
jgi:hypothetical protein